MRIKKFVIGMVGTNCYVVYNENTKECFVVDPAAPSAPLVEFIRTEGLQLQGILLTHGPGGKADLSGSNSSDTWSF